MHSDDRRERIVQHCARCGARILWALTTSNHRWMPINVGAVENGNVGLTRDRSGIYATVFGPAEADERRGKGQRLHLAHAASCGRSSTALPLRPASRIR